MANMLLATMLFILSVTMFSFSVSYGALDRTFQGLDENVFRQAVNVMDASKPFFDEHVVESTVKTYLKTNLDMYKPMLKYSFMTEPLDGFYEEGVWRTTWIDITFYGDFLSTYHYESVSSFYIKEGEAIYG